MADDEVSDDLLVRRRDEGLGALLRILGVFGLVVLGAVVLGVLALGLANTEPGRAFVARQLVRIAPESGLTVRVGRLEGSLFDRLVIRDLRLGDPQGVFLVAPAVVLEWQPGALVRQHVVVDALEAGTVRLLRLPKLRDVPKDPDEPILPDIDIDVGRLRIDRLIIERPVIGRRQIASISGSGMLRDQRARVALDATTNAADRIAVRLDAAPDHDRFDIEATVRAPADGVIAGLAGIKRPLDLTISGDGSWRRWQGVAVARLGGQSLLDVRIDASDGHFSLNGTAAPSAVFGGLPARLTAPQVAIKVTAEMTDRRVQSTVRLSSPALAIDARGIVDLGRSRFEDVAVDATLLRPEVILQRMRGRDIHLGLAISGPIATPTIDYAFTTPSIAVAATTFEAVRAAGRVEVGEGLLVIPVTATARRVTGVGEVAGQLLTNVRVEGPLTYRGGLLYSNALRLRSDRLTARAVASIVFATGAYDVALVGNLPRYPIRGLGLVDLDADVRVVPDPNRRDTRLRGRVTARVIRLDNATARSILGGLPTITANIDRAPDGTISFTNARLTSPDLQLTGGGSYLPNGELRLTASGRSRRYGPLDLRLSGPIAQPTADVRLASYDAGVRLTNIVASLVPTPDAYLVDVRADSPYGPVTGRARLVTRPAISFDIASLQVAGITARGLLRPTAAGPLAGTLTIAGTGIDGTLRLAAAGDVQRVDADLQAQQARLPIEQPVTLGSGSLQAAVLLHPNAPTVTGKFNVSDLVQGDLALDSASGTVDYRGGRGQAQIIARGERGVPFALTTNATFAPDRMTAVAEGSVSSQPVRLANPAVLTKIPGGWRLAPTTLVLRRSKATLSGTFADTTSVNAELDSVALRLLDLVTPGLGLSGRVSGTVNATFPAGGALPRGRASLRIANFSRAGLAVVSQPIDVGIAAVIEGNVAATRAVFQNRGNVIGRLQAQLRPIPGGVDDPLSQRLLAAPLSAQLRLNGPAEAIWPLVGIEAFDVRGPVAVAFDAGGRLGEPTVRGLIRTRSARLESAVLGTVIENIQLDSRFDGSRLQIASLTGTTGREGQVSGSGAIDLSAERGFPIDLRLQLKNATVINRDDLRATVTGPLRISSGREGGLISGNLNVDRARFRIGRTAAAEIPEMAVRERNVRLVRRTQPRQKPTVWQLNLTAKANNQIDVRGMGLDSEWEADLQIKGPVDAPRLIGDAKLVRGEYDFAGRSFELRRGLIRFNGSYPYDPVIDIAAEARVTGLTATLIIRGTGQRPEIAFSSIPALPQDEVLSRVLFGTSITNLSAPEAIQLAGAVAALRGGGGGPSLDPVNALRRATGLDRLRVLSGNDATGQGTALAAGEYLTDRVYVELASDAQGFTATQIEIELTRSLSILSSISTLGETSINFRWSKDY